MIAVCASGASAETLDEALAYTYVANPALLSQRARLRSLYENISTAAGGYKPVLRGQASYGYLYRRQKSRPLFSEEESRPVTLGVSAVQPLFSGFKTLAEVRAARENFEAEEQALNHAEQSKLLEAVGAYTEVIRATAVLRLNQNNVAVFKRELDYTKDRFRVGEVTRTDVAQSEARHASAVAGLIAAEGALKVAYSGYQNVVGKMPERIYEPESPAAKLPQTIEDALAEAEKNSPYLKNAELLARAAESNIAVAESGHYPTVEIQASYINSRANGYGSYSVIRAGQLETVETGRARQEDTSVKLVLDVPLYTAGTTVSKVRQAKHVAGQAKIAVYTVRRALTERTTSAWENYQATKASLSSLNEVVKATELAASGVRHEEEAGTRTVLDVLNAEQELMNARVNVVAAKKNLLDASYALLAAMGRMTPENLGLDIDRYRKDSGRREKQTVKPAEPVSEPAPGPVQESVSEPAPEPVPEAASEPAPEPAAEPVPEPARPAEPAGNADEPEEPAAIVFEDASSDDENADDEGPL